MKKTIAITGAPDGINTEMARQLAQRLVVPHHSAGAQTAGPRHRVKAMALAARKDEVKPY